MKKAVPEKLPAAEWNFGDVPDDELWACLIWEYGRSADWVHGILPQHGHVDKTKVKRQIERFHSTNPSNVLKLLNEMRLQQWVWSQNHGLQQEEFFPKDSWTQLPEIVRTNMRRVVAGLEPKPNLPLLDKFLRENNVNKALQIAEILRDIKAASDTPEEISFADEPQHWLPGGNGLDDVTEGVIMGERFLPRLRDGMAQVVAGKITNAEAQQQLQECNSGEIRLGLLREHKESVNAGYYAVAFRLNWHLKNCELVEKFEQWLHDYRPPKFRDKSAGNRKTTRGPHGLDLYVLRGGKKKTVQPLTALSSLGSWRKLNAAGNQKQMLTLYHPLLSGKKYDSQMASYSRDCRDTDNLFDQLFPKSSS
jgi:hypothetical protein